MFRLLLICVVLLLLGSVVTAQEAKEKDSTWTQSKKVVPLKPVGTTDTTKVDTIYYTPDKMVREAQMVSNPIDYEEHLTQRPTIALFKSMLVPGWGQLGNRKYVKAVVIIGLEGWLFSEAIHYGRQASDRWDRFQAEPDPATRDYYYSLYQDRRSLRNKYTWFGAITVFASMFDAYVDAHLSGAPDQARLSRVKVDVKPNKSGGVSANLSVRF